MYYDGITIILKKQIIVLNRFRSLFYSLKYKRQFRKWLWINVKEKKIKEKYSPANLITLLENVKEEDEENFDEILNDW